ncbi:acylneuraminate cytidylyltransferase family protein [uncultured Neptuniibacter sp.]|uniref:acylneuraminate cytidylyltransferase family protein n=1 Tax=uncultured Neptuniibacter sp. TaxID=502143 RepID=UPI00260DC152|nr:acylneuraminate cytidylyltransferase family protein [uncultured Neptuniibacter sp.]
MIKSAVAIIPARGGSKGVPRKNLVELNGAPLIWWSIKAALESGCIDKVIVTSDDDDILSVSHELGADVVKRPYELATDEASTLPVLRHALLSMTCEERAHYQYLILLQPTSPLRTSRHIEEAFQLIREGGGDAVISVLRRDSSPLKWFVEKDGVLQGAVNAEFPFLRRQDLPNVCSANGAIYIIGIDEFLKNESLLTKNTLPYYMDEAVSIDIDDTTDLQKAEMIMADSI